MRCAAPVSSSEMVVLRCSDVPLYLRDSDFYRNLDKGDDEEFALSIEHFKRDTSVRNDSDLDHLLSTLRFWGSVCFPETAIVFIMQCSQEMLGYILKKYGDELSIISSIDSVRKAEPRQKMNKAIEGGSLELVQFLLREGHNFCKDSAELAAKAGSVPILKYMLENGHCIESSASKGAAEMGHVHCLQYLRSISILWHKNVGVIAAACGQLTCLKYVVEHGHEIIDKDHACIYAAQNGHYACLNYLVDHNLHAPAEYWIRCAAYSGNLPCLQLAYSLANTWPTGIQQEIIIRQNFECFVYSVENGCHYTWDEVCSIAGWGLLQHLQYIKTHTTFTLNELTIQAALSEGHLDIVKFLYEAGCPWDFNPYTQVIKHGHYDGMVFMHQHGAMFEASDCTLAAHHGRLQCLQYMHSHGALWDETTCRAAAENGHLDCLTYLHEHSCPWDAKTTTAALQYKHTDCYKYAKDNGCPMPHVGKRLVKWFGL